jgi:succinate-semialdehyde dehydrogenase/glutarate-semialdehyde dehydrogenase
LTEDLGNISSRGMQHHRWVEKEAAGVVAAIIAYNYPNQLALAKLAPALAAGCTVVLKPASATPFSALALAQIAEEAGVPAGVFSVVTGSARAIGGELTRNPKVRKLTFTGSTEIGVQLMRECAETVKKVSMELGGNAPFLVFDDADVDAAVDGAIVSKFRNNGQTCVCTNRFYVQDGVYDEFVEKLAKRVGAMKLGYGMDEGVVLGPLIDEAAVEKVEEHLENALAGVIRFKDEDEAIRLANDSEFGLASYFYARDLSRVWRVGEALEAGIVGINTGLISTEVAPFGGIKQSGLGREGSKHGLDDYMELKYLCMGL